MAQPQPIPPPPPASGASTGTPSTAAHPTPSASGAPTRAPSLARSGRRASHSQSSAGGSAGLARRPSRAAHPPMAAAPLKPLSHAEALDALRAFLKERSSYDVFPVSFRLIVLDIQLKVKKALDVMFLYGVVSAPLWNTTDAKFAGMFTVQDVIHLIQYYYHTSSWEGAAADVEQFRLQSLRDIERELHVPPPPLLSIHPLRPLLDACKNLIQTHARRLPLIDKDTQTNGDVVISVLTQYRVLKFIATNYLSSGVRELGIGTYVRPQDGQPFYPIATATMHTTVFDVVHMFSELGISAVPIVDDDGKVINLYETVDVITLVRLGAYQSLDFTIAQALKQRQADFPGVVTCSPSDSLGAIFSLIKIRRVHRLVVVEGRDSDRPGTLVGVISLSDIMRHLIGEDIEISSSGAVGPRPPETVDEEVVDDSAIVDEEE